MEPRSLIMALALSRRKEMGSSLSPWQALALPSAISIPHLPSTQPSLAHFPALSYKWFLEPSRFSDSSSLRQGFYETTFPWAESASHQKVSSVWISPARVKAAAWRAYVRESRGACMLCAECGAQNWFWTRDGDWSCSLSEFVRIGMCHKEIILQIR